MQIKVWGMRALWLFVALFFGSPLLIGAASVTIGPLVGAALILGAISLIQIPFWCAITARAGKATPKNTKSTKRTGIILDARL
jgi:hypothetical protein